MPFPNLGINVCLDKKNEVVINSKEIGISLMARSAAGMFGVIFESVTNGKAVETGSKNFYLYSVILLGVWNVLIFNC